MRRSTEGLDLSTQNIGFERPVGRAHNVVWTKNLSHPEKYPHSIHPHGSAGQEAALAEAKRLNRKKFGNTKTASMNTGGYEAGFVYLYDRYCPGNKKINAIHGVNDGYAH